MVSLMLALYGGVVCVCLCLRVGLSGFVFWGVGDIRVVRAFSTGCSSVRVCVFVLCTRGEIRVA